MSYLPCKECGAGPVDCANPSPIVPMPGGNRHKKRGRLRYVVRDSVAAPAAERRTTTWRQTLRSAR
jgi:hypothetical protein